jgi:hypothetical protein
VIPAPSRERRLGGSSRSNLIIHDSTADRVSAAVRSGRSLHSAYATLTRDAAQRVTSWKACYARPTGIIDPSAVSRR